MRGVLLFAGGLLLGLLAGLGVSVGDGFSEVTALECDTVATVDTARFLAPEARGEVLVGMVAARVAAPSATSAPISAPLARLAPGKLADAGGAGFAPDKARCSTSLGNSLGRAGFAPDKPRCNSSLGDSLGRGGGSASLGDSLDVLIPIVQRVYEDSVAGGRFRAFVSGYEPRLDSIFIFPRHETVTVRETVTVTGRQDLKAGRQDPKRWHLGATAGYALTPHGLQPYLGVGVSFSIYSW